MADCTNLAAARDLANKNLAEAAAIRREKQADYEIALKAESDASKAATDAQAAWVACEVG